jgi:glycosyltransferase involved in cell wall biosynthesis
LKNIPDLQSKSLTSFGFKGKKWLQEQLGRAGSLKTLQSGSPDIFHPTYFGDYFLDALQRQKTPFVLTVHDMIHEKFGHGKQSFFSLDKKVVENKRKLAQLASAIVVVSENTRNDLLRHMPELNPEKIHTVYHGSSLHRNQAGSKNQLILPERYLLFVGQRGAYKNFNWMLKELAPLIHTYSDLYLVCVGGFGINQTEKTLIQNLNLSNKVVHAKVHTDEELAELYARAQCFIFPSSYEGFGIPVLEAFACSCPVLLNASSSLPEVGSDAALYFQDGNGDDLRSLTEMILNNKELSKLLIINGLNRLKSFSWQNTVLQHEAIYKQVLAVQ